MTRRLLARPQAFEHGAPAHQVGDTEQPGAARTEQHEPQDHAEHPVVGLHEDGVFHRARALHRICRGFALGDRLGPLRAAYLIGFAERARIVLDVFGQRARSQRQEQHDQGESEIGQSEQHIGEVVGDQRHRQGGRQRQQRGDQQGAHGRRRAQVAQAPVEIAIEPARLAQV